MAFMGTNSLHAGQLVTRIWHISAIHNQEYLMAYLPYRILISNRFEAVLKVIEKIIKNWKKPFIIYKFSITASERLILKS
jgi:hypothetical protein